jgi:hypothetical protein
LYNGAPLAFRVRMRTVALLLAVLGCAPLPATGQEIDAPEGALIESATVSGISFDQLSPGLRSDISALEGTPLDRGQGRCAGDSHRGRAARDGGGSPPLEQTNWNVSGAARLLGVERTNLHKRMRSLGLSRQ